MCAMSCPTLACFVMSCLSCYVMYVMFVMFVMLCHVCHVMSCLSCYAVLCYGGKYRVLMMTKESLTTSSIFQHNLVMLDY